MRYINLLSTMCSLYAPKSLNNYFINAFQKKSTAVSKTVGPKPVYRDGFGVHHACTSVIRVNIFINVHTLAYMHDS